MGPIILFDKSFLQSLDVDEAVWFDHFFCPNICPVFFVEALADLEKAVRQGRTPEQAVGSLARKAPQASGYPNAFHSDLCVGELAGATVPMSGQIPITRGKYVELEGRTGIVYPEPREAIAMSRWQRGQFLDAERMAARYWRARLAAIDHAAVENAVGRIAPPASHVRDLVSAKQAADEFLRTPGRMAEALAMAVALLGIPPRVCKAAFRRWQGAGPPPLTVTAPYTAFVLSIVLFFYYATARSLVSRERISNFTDTAYLFYLPFTTFFTSADKLHQRCVPLFLRDDQRFIWGPDLKQGLRAIDKHYDRLPSDIKRKGICEFAPRPPKEGAFLISQLWDFGGGCWRGTPPLKDDLSGDQVAHLLKQAKAWTLAPEVSMNSGSAPAPTMEILTRHVTKKRGKWYQVPADLD